jgi:hypothetical protein
MPEHSKTPLKDFAEEFANHRGITLNPVDIEQARTDRFNSCAGSLIKQYVGDIRGCSDLIGLSCDGGRFYLNYIGWSRVGGQLYEVLRGENTERTIDIQSFPGYNGRVVVRDLKTEGALQHMRKIDGMGSAFDREPEFSFAYTFEKYEGVREFLETMLDIK